MCGRGGKPPDMRRVNPTPHAQQPSVSDLRVPCAGAGCAVYAVGDAAAGVSRAGKRGGRPAGQRCLTEISLGRHDGVVRSTHADDRPREFGPSTTVPGSHPSRSWTKVVVDGHQGRRRLSGGLEAGHKADPPRTCSVRTARPHDIDVHRPRPHSRRAPGRVASPRVRDAGTSRPARSATAPLARGSRRAARLGPGHRQACRAGSSAASWAAVRLPATYDRRAGHTFRGVDIPVAFRWVLLALAVLQLLSLIPILRRMRRAEPARRTEARLDLLDAASGFTLMAGLALGNSAVMLCGLVLMGSAIAAKGARTLRECRRT